MGGKPRAKDVDLRGKNPENQLEGVALQLPESASKYGRREGGRNKVKNIQAENPGEGKQRKSAVLGSKGKTSGWPCPASKEKPRKGEKSWKYTAGRCPHSEENPGQSAP